MSKGSSPRPFSVSQQEYDERWDAIFNRPTQREVDDAKAEAEAFKSVEENNKDTEKSV